MPPQLAWEWHELHTVPPKLDFGHGQRASSGRAGRRDAPVRRLIHLK